MKQKKSYCSTLKWGLILGAGLAVFELVKMCARQINYSSTQLLDLALLIGFVLILFWGMKEFKALYTERLTFAKAYFGCILISLIGSVIFSGYCLVHYQVVEPNGLEKRYEIALDNYKNSIEKDTISAEELSEYLDTIQLIFKVCEHDFILPDTLDETSSTEVHEGVSKIAEFHKRKLEEKRALDTTQSYQLCHFTGFSRKMLIETLVAYMEQNEQKTSTPFVKQIIDQVNVALAEINPVELRFERNKSRVPHYDKTGRYAAIASVMNLLYGMFLGLFIAMFHYTSKRTAAEAEAAARAAEDDNTHNG